MNIFQGYPQIKRYPLSTYISDEMIDSIHNASKFKGRMSDRVAFHLIRLEEAMRLGLVSHEEAYKLFPPVVYRSA